MSKEVAIKALEEALANLEEALAKQEQGEPVACSMCNEWEKVCDQHLRHIAKLKKKRTWVGLTDEERKEIALEVPMDAVCITEAKLKEKNT